ncbi:hypothetical protein RF11_16185 [Thelohanellus kitauei]|uniref:Uncharacterized protein n=1 Tax=Thelohanellus kitauei TaxID=669202 RepID=A0A0C2NE39_THEKT|nr:hypothetical protein RF11_16185 [Thelohanellus kitauei]
MPVHEVTWLSRHFAVTPFVRNYNKLINYFTDELNIRNDEISNIPTPMEALQFVKSKIFEIRSLYVGETVHWSDAMKEVIDSNDHVIDKKQYLDLLNYFSITLR